MKTLTTIALTAAFLTYVAVTLTALVINPWIAMGLGAAPVAIGWVVKATTPA